TSSLRTSSRSRRLQGSSSARGKQQSEWSTASALDFLIHHMLRTSAKRRPGHEALVHGDERLSYADVRRRVRSLAHGLRAAGIRRGDRVGIYLEPSVAQALAIFAISEAGGVFVPINAMLFPEQVRHVAVDCGMTALVTSASKLRSFQPVLERIPSLGLLVVVDDGARPLIALPGQCFGG